MKEEQERVQREEAEALEKRREQEAADAEAAAQAAAEEAERLRLQQEADAAQRQALEEQQAAERKRQQAVDEQRRVEEAEASSLAQMKANLDEWLKQNKFEGPNIKRKTLVKAKFALHSAVKQNNFTIVQALLRFGADPSLTDSNKLTPKQLAMKNNKGGVLDQIVEALTAVDTEKPTNHNVGGA